MRSRNIKPGFFENEKLAELPPLARLLFAGLWCYADKEGRFEWRPKRIKALILPYDNCNIEELLMSLHAMTFIVMYRHGNDVYGHIPKFKNHQNPHPHEAKSRIPEPSEKPEEIQCHDMSVTLHGMSDKCNADVRIPDSGFPYLPPSPKEKKPLPDEAVRLAGELADYILDNNPNHRELSEDRRDGTIQRWASDIDKMNRLDNRAWDDIGDMIDWCQNDNFWKGNILSGKKLREQYDKMFFRMDSKPQRGNDEDDDPYNDFILQEMNRIKHEAQHGHS